ncbi:MAG: hypothetical protein IT495_06685 [Gammaproteobacteria bacterium]|nr:hypothetical protein [Gammaproteobacteria bacterium]
MHESTGASDPLAAADSVPDGGGDADGGKTAAGEWRRTFDAWLATAAAAGLPDDVRALCGRIAMAVGDFERTGPDLLRLLDPPSGDAATRLSALVSRWQEAIAGLTLGASPDPIVQGLHAAWRGLPDALPALAGTALWTALVAGAAEAPGGPLRERADAILATLARYRVALDEFAGVNAAFARDAISRYTARQTRSGSAAEASADARYRDWLDCCEQAHTAMLRSTAYSVAFGRLFNAAVALRAGVQASVDDLCALFALPRREEIESLQRAGVALQARIRALETQLTALADAPGAPQRASPVPAGPTRKGKAPGKRSVPATPARARAKVVRGAPDRDWHVDALMLGPGDEPASPRPRKRRRP